MARARSKNSANSSADLGFEAKLWLAVEIYGLQPNGAGISAIFVNGNDCVIKGLGKAYLRGHAVVIATIAAKFPLFKI